MPGGERDDVGSPDDGRGQAKPCLHANRHEVGQVGNLTRSVCDDCSAILWRHTVDIAEQVNSAMRGLCHHCGQPPEADGDHSCPCPHSDHECPSHPEPR